MNKERLSRLKEADRLVGQKYVGSLEFAQDVYKKKKIKPKGGEHEQI